MTCLRTVALALACLTGIGWVLSLFRLFCIIKGISNAIQGKKEPLPFIGTLGNF